MSLGPPDFKINNFQNQSFTAFSSLSLGPPELQINNILNLTIREFTNLSLGHPELQIYDFQDRSRKDIDKSEPGRSRVSH